MHFYGCTSFWKRGANVCANNLVARMERRRGYAFEGVIALARLVAGVVDLATVMASPRPFDTLRRPLFRGVLDFSGGVKLAA